MPGLLFAFGSATSAGSNSCRHGQFHFDLDHGSEGDFELKGPCDKARFFGVLKQVDDPVTILFIQDGDDRAQLDFRKTPDTIRAAEQAFRVQVEGRKFQGVT